MSMTSGGEAGGRSGPPEPDGDPSHGNHTRPPPEPPGTAAAEPPRDPAEGGVDRQDAASGGVLCDLCGTPMLERHCRLVCLTCGYERDCSDP